MKPSDFELIERTLGFSLPETYKSFLSSYPIEADDDIRLHAHFTDPKRVIEENLRHRKDGWFRRQWPSHYFVIGDDGCGDTYFMVIGKDDRVYFADHEAGPNPIHDLEECCSNDSLSDHLKEALLLAKEYQEEQRLREERHKNRKWWEIWK